MKLFSKSFPVDCIVFLDAFTIQFMVFCVGCFSDCVVAHFACLYSDRGCSFVFDKKFHSAVVLIVATLVSIPFIRLLPLSYRFTSEQLDTISEEDYLQKASFIISTIIWGGFCYTCFIDT